MNDPILYDHNDRPIVQASGDSAYHGASATAPDMAVWWPRSGSADADLLPELKRLIPRSRDLERNNGVASGAPQTFVDHVIGPDLKLSVRPNWRALGQTEEWAKEWSEKVESLWKPYAQSLFFDSERQVNFVGMAELVLRGRFSNGGHLIIPKWLPNRPGAKYGTCFQAIEIDRLCNPGHRPNTTQLRGGIEYDRNGAPLAYWIRNSHPGDRYGSGLQTNDFSWQRIPAMTPWGRPRVLHCYHKTRSGQSRAAPALASILADFKSLSRYRHAELQAAVANAMVTFFVETQMGFEDISAMFQTASQDYLEHRKTHGQWVREQLHGSVMDQNMIVPVTPGDRVTSPRQTRPNSEFAPFSEGVLRHIAAGLNVSYETLLRDFSRTNYSSARAAMLMDWKTFLGQRSWINTYYSNLSYRLWLEEVVNRRDLDVEAPDFYQRLDAYCNASWTGPGRGLIDPPKETKASIDRLQNGLSSLQDEAAEQGKDYQDVMDQRAREIRAAFDKAEQLELPEAAAYVLAGLPAPKSATTKEPNPEELTEESTE